MRFLVVFIISVFWISGTASKNPKKRNVGEIQSFLEGFRSDMMNLKNEAKNNSEKLEELSGFLSAMKLGVENTRDPCGNDFELEYNDDSKDPQWILHNPLTCIKLLPLLYSMEDAHEACSNEFQIGSDIEYPQVLSVRSSKENLALVKYLHTVPRLTTSIWINSNNESGQNYSNWAAGSSSAAGDCIELRNDPVMNINGKWNHVDCSRVNNVICEKTVTLSYANLVRRHIALFLEFQEHTNNPDLHASAQYMIQQFQSQYFTNMTSLLQGFENKWKFELEGLKSRQEQLSQKSIEIQGKAQILETAITNNSDKLDHLSRNLNTFTSNSESNLLALETKVIENDNSLIRSLAEKDKQLAEAQIQINGLQKLVQSLQGVVKTIQEKLITVTLDQKSQKNRLEEKEGQIENVVKKLDRFSTSTNSSIGDTNKRVTEALDEINKLKSQSPQPTSNKNTVDNAIYDYGDGDNIME